MSDEDTITQEPELDPEDEPQSWENFQSAAQLKRGAKEFEPDDTEIQKTQLQKSLGFMFQALEAPRTHTVKQNIRCIFNDDVIKCELKGNYLQTMGSVKGDWCILHPEEAIYLVERGTVEPFWEESDGTLKKLDLQSVYALVMDDLAEYQVYGNLKRCGYTVLRHDKTRERQQELVHKSTPIWKLISTFIPFKVIKTLLQRIGLVHYPAFTPQWLFNKLTSTRQLLRSLQLPFPQRQGTPPSTPLEITFDIWKPSPSFSKKAPPLPDFQIIVRDISTHKLPTLSQLQDLFSRVSYYNQSPASTQSKRLKEGENAILFGLVDHGVINYTRLSSASFHEEDIIRL